MSQSKEEQIKELLTRGVKKIIDKKSLTKKLNSGKVLRIKHGVDPTTPDLHLGYAVVYRKLKAFQDLGHKIIFLIGDFTGRFGDPTDKGDKTREMRDTEKVKKMADNYLKQIGKILDINKLELRYNGEWYDKMSAEELLRLMSRFTVRRMLERDMFEERDKKGLEIGLHEPVYPVLQGYDSVKLESDVTVIGSDQEFNELQGRRAQEMFKQTPQEIMIMPILIGTDGKQKMSQSLDNYIGLSEKPQEMFGKIMSMPDYIIFNYFELCTDYPISSIEKMKKDMEEEKINPRDLKLKLAEELVKIYHSPEEAQKAKDYFINTFSKKEIPQDISEIKVKEKEITLIDFMVLAKSSKSKAEARRKIEQGGVEINGQRVDNWQKVLYNDKNHKSTLKLGKHEFVKIVFT